MFLVKLQGNTTKTTSPRHNCGVPSQQLCVDPGSEVVVGISQGSTAEVQPFGLTASPGLTCRVPQTCRVKDFYSIPVLRLRWAYNESYATTAYQGQVLRLHYPCLATEVGLQQIICHHSMSSTGSELQCICEICDSGTSDPTAPRHSPKHGTYPAYPKA